MVAADGCASSSSNPRALLLRRLGPASRGSGGRHVRALTGLGMLICRKECVTSTHRIQYSHSRFSQRGRIFPVTVVQLFMPSKKAPIESDRVANDQIGMGTIISHPQFALDMFAA
jgi:hypothetical protein